MDPILRPEFTHYLVGRISEFFTEYHRRCFEAGRGVIDTTQVTDDFGSQTGLHDQPAHLRHVLSHADPAGDRPGKVLRTVLSSITMTAIAASCCPG